MVSGWNMPFPTVSAADDRDYRDGLVKWLVLLELSF